VPFVATDGSKLYPPVIAAVWPEADPRNGGQKALVLCPSLRVLRDDDLPNPQRSK
jgi:hypothetical protein